MNQQRRSPEVADIFRGYGNRYRDKKLLTAQQYKVMRRIEICRTAALGGHVCQSAIKIDPFQRAILTP